jgi:hypothetical protein
VGVLVDLVVDALSSALLPKSTWGFIVRAAVLIVAVVVVAELT